jgi:hypothetical protein
MRQRKNMIMIDCNLVGKAPLSCPEYPLSTSKVASFRNRRVQRYFTSELGAQDEREGWFTLVFSLRLENLIKI